MNVDVFIFKKRVFKFNSFKFVHIRSVTVLFAPNFWDHKQGTTLLGI
jgi:hypothetical protein